MRARSQSMVLIQYMAKFRLCERSHTIYSNTECTMRKKWTYEWVVVKCCKLKNVVRHRQWCQQATIDGARFTPRCLIYNILLLLILRVCDFDFIVECTVRIKRACAQTHTHTPSCLTPICAILISILTVHCSILADTLYNNNDMNTAICTVCRAHTDTFFYVCVCAIDGPLVCWNLTITRTHIVNWCRSLCSSTVSWPCVCLLSVSYYQLIFLI